MLLTLASMVIVLGVVIFVHEFGHFIVAKAVGIQVLRFSLGFGQPVIAWKRGETEYWISWIPLGGYVKMAGMEEEGMVGELEGGKADAAIDPERAFDRKPLAARLAVILAGVSMNVVLAFVIYFGLAAIAGALRPALLPVDSVDVANLPPGAEALATLHRGERIVRVNGDSLKTWDELDTKITHARDPIALTIAGRPQPIMLHLARDTAARHAVIRALTPQIPPLIGPVIIGQPAYKAGLKADDLVLRMNGDTVQSWTEMVQRVRASRGKRLLLTVRRGTDTLSIAVTPVKTDSAGQDFGVIGAAVNPPTVRVPVSLGDALGEGLAQTWTQVATVVVGVERLVTGRASPKELGGPLAIAQMSGQAARLGLDWFLNFLGFLSVSLAILNLLPIPVLDGGHAVFLIAEGIRRKPLSAQLRMRLTQAGMILVLAIMILAISNDVLRFFH